MPIKASVRGRLTKDAEEAQLGQTTALKFTVASNRSRKDKNGERTADFVDVVYFRTALKQYLTKGKFVIIDGELEAFPWTTKDGTTKAGLQMVADSIDFGPKEDAQQGAQQPQAPQVAQQPTQPQKSAQQPQESPQQDIFSDQLPF